MAVELEHLGLLEDSFNTYSKTSQFLEILRVEQGVEVGQLMASVDQAMNSVQNKLLKDKKEQEAKKIRLNKERPKTSVTYNTKFRIKKDNTERVSKVSNIPLPPKPRPHTSILKVGQKLSLKEKPLSSKKSIPFESH